MKKLAGLLIAIACTNVHASIDNVKISGFGSVVAGKSNNDANYMEYDSQEWEFDQDTLLGLQIEAKINDQAKFVTQLVAQGRYDYDIEAEAAYFSYEANVATVRVGKMRTPFFMYSDYLDVGYAYPMLRPSDALYDNIIVSTFKGMDLLIPIEFDNSTLVFQPFYGVSKLDERDAPGILGTTTFNDFVGATMHWYIEDFTFRGSYAMAQSEYTADEVNKDLLDDKKGEFASLGAQYDNGELLTMVEAAQIKLEGEFSDTLSVSGLVGYRMGSVTPYLSTTWLKTTDDELRNRFQAVMTYKVNEYAIGTRWDVAKNVALKVDVTYTEFDESILHNDFELDTVVYSTAIDFIF